MTTEKNTYVFHQFEQRSEEWKQIRIGKIGGSEAIGLSTPARMKSIIPLKMAEIETGEDQNSGFISDAMKEGIDKEPIVHAEYEKREFLKLEHKGYIENKRYKYLGISPDGLILTPDNNNVLGAIEIKCPQPKGHIACIIEGKIPAEYRPQVSHLFFILKNIEWVDFISYNEKVKSKPYFKIRVTREEWLPEIKKIEVGYSEYVKKIEANFKILKQL